MAYAICHYRNASYLQRDYFEFCAASKKILAMYNKANCNEGSGAYFKGTEVLWTFKDD